MSLLERRGSLTVFLYIPGLSLNDAFSVSQNLPVLLFARPEFSESAPTLSRVFYILQMWTRWFSTYPLYFCYSTCSWCITFGTRLTGNLPEVSAPPLTGIPLFGVLWIASPARAFALSRDVSQTRARRVPS